MPALNRVHHVSNITRANGRSEDSDYNRLQFSVQEAATGDYTGSDIASIITNAHLTLMHNAHLCIMNTYTLCLMNCCYTDR